MDRLGLAQMISRIGLVIDGNSGDSLVEAKSRWIDDARWQELRRLVEDTFVVDDWYELLVAQDFAIDGIVYALFFGSFENGAGRSSSMVLSMLTETFRDWSADTGRWIDSVIKKTAGESAANAAILARWYATWRDRAIDACRPIASEVLGAAAERALDSARAALDKRAAASGLAR
jgi:phenol hydroxylase P1 protein